MIAAGVVLLCLATSASLAPARQPQPRTAAHGLGRRDAAARLAAAAAALSYAPPSARAAQNFDDSQFSTLPSGVQVADVKVGTGPTPREGERVRIDYVMFTTGARYGAKIYSTRDDPSSEPFTFALGKPGTIAGLSDAVAGMRAGGVRRAVIPASRGYTAYDLQPQPPEFGAFQRFKNIYLNENRPYQPDLVLDIKLFGPRDAPRAAASE